MPDTAPAQEMALLEVKTHLDAEIFLIGNDRQLIARAVGRLQTKQPKGLYRIKVTRASAGVERLLELDGDQMLSIDVPGLDTVVPFQRTTKPEALPKIEGLAARATSGDGNSGPVNFLLVGRMPAAAVQQWKGESGPASVSPLSPVRFALWNATSESTSGVSKTEEQTIDNERWAFGGKTLQPGTYILEVLDGIRATRQAVPVLPNWQTRIFVRRQPAPVVLSSEKSERPDLINVAVHMSHVGMPIALQPVYESSEIARLALAMGSHIVVSREILDIFLDEKFTDPIAGIAAAHLMFDTLEHARSEASKSSSFRLQSISIEPALVSEVLTNLFNLLQMPNGILPDLVALKLRAKVPLADPEKMITEPPVYAQSWEALIGASTGAAPQINISADLFGRCAANYTLGPYFAWTPTSVASYVEHLIANNQHGLQRIGTAIPETPAPLSAPTRQQVKTNVRDHIANVFETDRSRLRLATNLTKKFRIDQRGLQNLVVGINQTDWMKRLPFDLEASDMKGLSTIGDIADTIWSKASRNTPSTVRSATPKSVSSLVRRRATRPAATFQSIIASDQSRFKLADEIGIPRSVFDALVTQSGSDALQTSNPLPTASVQRLGNAVATTLQPTVSAPALSISQRAFDMILEFEVTSEQSYEDRYRRPTWPGESSGVTIGIGYDVGYVSKKELYSDWQSKIPDAMVSAIEEAVGVKGSAARPLAATLSGSVDIPWTVAIGVHGDAVIPRWVGVVEQALANCRIVGPDCLGALVSLTYDRGASYSKSGEQFKEMRAIKQYMAALEFSSVAAEIRAMKRLWPDNPGLQARRDREAKLFDEGLSGKASL
jgi:hypothetical protein